MTLVKQVKPKTKRPPKRPSNEAQQLVEDMTPSKKVGRPRIEFDGDRAKNLISLGFTMSQVSNALGISDGTLRRFRHLEDCRLYDKLSNEELDKIVLDIKKEHPMMGEKRLLGLLRGRGLRIQRSRLRECIHRVDPNGPKQRCNAGILLVNSRTSTGENGEPKPKIVRVKKETSGIQVPANCPAPNSIWRIDTIEKLERWKIGVTYGLDMFSRLMVFMVASNMGVNQAENIESAFRASTKKYAWPDMISTDEKDEKVLVWKSMVDEKGDLSVEMSSKLERVQWVTIIKNDLNNSVFTPMIDTFTQLEIEGSLNVSNETDLFCLHFVYLPRINKLLQDFACCYNACCIPRGSGATPSQIFYAHNENVSVNNKDILPNLLSNEDFSDISLQSVSPIPVEKLNELKKHVNPLEDSSDNGKDLYYRTGTFVTQCLKEVIENMDSNPECTKTAFKRTEHSYGEPAQILLEESQPEATSHSVVVVESVNEQEASNLVECDSTENIMIKINENQDAIQDQSAQEILKSLMSQAANIETDNITTSLQGTSATQSNIISQLENQQVVILDTKEGQENDLTKALLNIDTSSFVILNGNVDDPQAEQAFVTNTT